MPLSADPRLRAARSAAGLTHAQLAALTGLSRQAIGAIEAGRHRPSVDAAMALAAALGTSVEDLFGARAERGVSASVLGDAPTPGAPVVTARVGEQLVHAVVDHHRAPETWSVADGRWDGAATAGDAPHPDGFVVVGCDPALGLLAGRLPGEGPRRLVAVHGSTTRALDALAGGRTHGAIVHGRAGALSEPPPGTLRFHVARWQVGLASAGAGRSLSALVAGDATVAQRDDGASSQQALLRALEEAGMPQPRGPLAAGHLSAARHVTGGARAAVTIEPAAVSAGLDFLPLESHVVELWVAPEHRDHPGLQALGTCLVSTAVQAQLSAVGGYDLARCGARL